MQGKTINGFELKKLLGTGGMAEVWYAENEIGMKAAVKILSEELSHNAQMRDRFLNEAKVMVKLDHPNIRKVHGYGSIDGRPAIIMEYLDGSDLKARMKRGQHFTDEELRKWWNQVVDALNYTHALHIVHRDIKPSNIFIDQKGDAKLLDFGIAKVADTTSGTLTGSTLGTRIYMSPEQVKDPKRVGTASDVYSLAVTFVHLLTGKAPYDSTTSSDYDIQVSIVTKPVDMSKVPEEWRGFLTPYLNKEADKRPALRHFELVNPEEKAAKHTDDDTTLAEDEKQSEVKPVQKPKKKESKKKKSLLIALGIVAVVALFVLLLKPKQEPAPTDPDTLAYEACQTADDYRAYVRDFGLNALHYVEAQQFVKDFVADSTAKAEEDAAYGQCTTIADCESYLQTYPQGRYVAEVKAKKAELESVVFDENLKKEEAAYGKCTTIAACDNYLKTYPQGKYVDEVRTKKAQLETQAQEQPQQSLTGTANGHDYVDLGLPSGTLWATCNVGASKPEGYGNYYAWGETSTKNTYNWSTYKYANGDYNKLTKYCGKSDYGNNGFTDNLTTLQSGDDPTIVQWGNGWRTPSSSQWRELMDNTTNKWTIKNGVKGRLFTAKNGQTLFLPAAGYRSGSELRYAGSRGAYLSNSLGINGPTSTSELYFSSDDCVTSGGRRNLGYPVRPVRQK